MQKENVCLNPRVGSFLARLTALLAGVNDDDETLTFFSIPPPFYVEPDP